MCRSVSSQYSARSGKISSCRVARAGATIYFLHPLQLPLLAQQVVQQNLATTCSRKSVLQYQEQEALSISREGEGVLAGG